MSKNLIPQIAEMLGVALGEAFKIKGEDELMTYRFNADGLQVTYGDGIEIPYISTNPAFAALLNGTDEIVKLPWKPKEGEFYYSFGIFAQTWGVSKICWLQHPFDFALLAKGWVFHTKEEAQAALPKVAAEIGVKYRL